MKYTTLSNGQVLPVGNLKSITQNNNHSYSSTTTNFTTTSITTDDSNSINSNNNNRNSTNSENNNSTNNNTGTIISNNTEQNYLKTKPTIITKSTMPTANKIIQQQQQQLKLLEQQKLLDIKLKKISKFHNIPGFNLYHYTKCNEYDFYIWGNLIVDWVRYISNWFDTLENNWKIKHRSISINYLLRLQYLPTGIVYIYFINTYNTIIIYINIYIVI